MPSDRGLARRRELLRTVAGMIFGGDKPTTWTAAAAAIRVPLRTLRRWRTSEEWSDILHEVSSELGERERVARAKAVLAAGMYDEDKLEARRCARDYLQIVAARTVELQGHVTHNFAEAWWARAEEVQAEGRARELVAPVVAKALPEVAVVAAAPEPEPRETVAS